MRRTESASLFYGVGGIVTGCPAAAYVCNTFMDES